MDRNSIEVTKIEARQGVTGQGVRYVLLGGLVLAGIAFIILMAMLK